MKPYTKNAIFQNEFYLSTTGIQYSRQVYGILDLIGDIGGIYQLIISAFGIVLFSIAEQSFVLNGISKLFLINTTDPDFINKKGKIIEDQESKIKQSVKIGPQQQNDKLEKEI